MSSFQNNNDNSLETKISSNNNTTCNNNNKNKSKNNYNNQNKITPIGLHQIKDFITNKESKTLVNLIYDNDNEWSYEGFEDRRRVQRYNSISSTMSSVEQTKKPNKKKELLSFLQSLIDRYLQQHTNIFTTEEEEEEQQQQQQSTKDLNVLIPNEIVIEERKLQKSSINKVFDTSSSSSSLTSSLSNNKKTKDEKSTKKKRPSATIFESNLQSKDESCTYCTLTSKSNDSNQQSKCSCYIAQLTLLSPCIQSMNKPKNRNIECWDLHTSMHSVDVMMNVNELLIKRDECFWNWRSRIAIYDDDDDRKKNCKKRSNDNDDGVDGIETKKDVEYPSRDDEKKEEEDDDDEVIKNLTIKFRCVHGEKQHHNKVASTSTTNNGSHEQKNDNTSSLIHHPMSHSNNSSSSSSSLSSIPNNLHQECNNNNYNPNSPLHELLTIIVTTSPIKSNPSTEMLRTTFDTFIYAGFDFCYNCPKVIICDGCRIKDDDNENRDRNASRNGSGNGSSSRTIRNTGAENGIQPTVTKKHANVKQSLRNGIATSDQAKNYELFKERLIELCKEAGEGVVNVDDYRDDEAGDDGDGHHDDDGEGTIKGSSTSGLSPFRNTRVVQLEERHGYGFALRHALRHEVKTPYVCVIQHDRTFMRHTPIHEVVQTMTKSKNGEIKYVGMNMRSNLCYRDIFTSKYAGGALNQLLEMVKTPPELLLDASIYGPKGVSVEDMVVTRVDTSKKLMKNIASLAQSYKGTIQCTSHTNPIECEEAGKQQLSLTPTLFWYDNTHVCETSHYRDFIFNPRYKMVVRGGFVEDKLSPVITRSVERLGLKEGHSKFGCYLLDDHSGFFFTGHIDGGSFMTQDERERLIKQRSK